MPEQQTSADRVNLLADVAEMYYWEGKNQDEIARTIGLTRSMVSRMITEARQRGIVEIRIHRPLQPDYGLQNTLVERFGLRAVAVLDLRMQENEHLLSHLGKAGADIIKGYLRPDSVLGLAWGTSVSATVDEIELTEPMPIKIVQLVGALGSRNTEYDGHGLVLRLTQKLNGEGYFLNAPFICPSPEIARSLLSTPGICETVAMSEACDLALLGIGSTNPRFSSFYLAGYVPLDELNQLIDARAIGDVCGLHFDVRGNEICADFCERLVTVRKDQLLSIPIRIGVAGGPGKAEPILGALRGGYINALVTDSMTARRVLELERELQVS